MEGFIFFFLFMVSWILFTDTFFLRHALFLLEFCSLFLLKGFLLVYLFERWQHFNFASTRTFSRVSWVLLHICCSQIVQAMTDPILRAAKGFSPWASVLLHLRTFGASYFIFFIIFVFFFTVSLTFFRFFLYFQRPQSEWSFMVPLASGWAAFCDRIAQMHIHSGRMIICLLAHVPWIALIPQQLFRLTLV